MFGMGSNLVVAAFIAVLMIVIAFAAAGALICGIWSWRKKRFLASIFIIPSTLYLIFFLFIFIPRPLPQYTVHLDLRHPDDLSGLPAATGWMSTQWPQPAKILPLAEGSFCCVEGKVDVSIILPDGQQIHDSARNIFIHTDTKGVRQVDMNVYSAPPSDALSHFKPYIWPIGQSSQTRVGPSTPLDQIERDLLTYKSGAPLADGFRVHPVGYDFQFGVGTTFVPSDHVSYFCHIELPRTFPYRQQH